MQLVAGVPVISWVVGHGECFMPGGGAMGIGMIQDGRIVAGVMYEEFTEASIHATIVIAPGVPMVRGFLKAIFDYPFNQLTVEKIIVQMSSGNKKSKELAERLGFVLEATVKGAYIDGDRLIYTMLKSDCKWLEMSHEKSENTKGT